MGSGISLSDTKKCICNQKVSPKKSKSLKASLQGALQGTTTPSEVSRDCGDQDLLMAELQLSQLNIECKKTPQNILYYGWFFDNEVSLAIKETAHQYFLECLKVKEFERFIKDACVASGAKEPESLYTHPRLKEKSSKDFKYHLTANFLDRLDNDEYSNLAKPFVGKIFKLHLVGLFFTPKTFGVRVKLSEGQLKLFDLREGSDVEKEDSAKYFLRSNSTAIQQTTILFQNQLTQDLKADVVEIEKHPKCSSEIHSKSMDVHGFAFLPQNKDFQPTKSRSHVTIGCCPKVRPVQAGIDLMDIVTLEETADQSSIFNEDVQIEGGTLRQFPNAFVVYPSHKIVANATFNYFI